MTSKQLKERLLLAALTEDIPEMPHIELPFEKSSRESKPNWIGYAATACIGAVITLPLLLQHPRHELYCDTCQTEEEAAQELAGAFAIVSQHIATQETNLLNMIQE